MDSNSSLFQLHDKEKGSWTNMFNMVHSIIVNGFDVGSTLFSNGAHFYLGGFSNKKKTVDFEILMCQACDCIPAGLELHYQANVLLSLFSSNKRLLLHDILQFWKYYSVHYKCRRIHQMFLGSCKLLLDHTLTPFQTFSLSYYRVFVQNYTNISMFFTVYKNFQIDYFILKVIFCLTLLTFPDVSLCIF